MLSTETLLLEIGSKNNQRKLSFPVHSEFSGSNLTSCMSGFLSSRIRDSSSFCQSSECIRDLSCGNDENFIGFEIVGDELVANCEKTNISNSNGSNSCPPILKKIGPLRCDENCSMSVEHFCEPSEVCVSPANSKCIVDGVEYSLGEKVITREMGQCVSGQGACGQGDGLVKFCAREPFGGYNNEGADPRYNYYEMTKDEVKDYRDTYTCPLEQSCFPSFSPGGAGNGPWDLRFAHSYRKYETCSNVDSVKCEGSGGEVWSCSLTKSRDIYRSTCFSGSLGNLELNIYQEIMNTLYSSFTEVNDWDAYNRVEKGIYEEFARLNYKECKYDFSQIENTLNLFRKIRDSNKPISEIYTQGFHQNVSKFFEVRVCGKQKGECVY